MTAPPGRDRGLGSWIGRHARTRPDAVALIHGETRRSYAELAARVRRLANALRELGVEPGARVLWLGDNHPAFLETLFAAASVGAVLAPVNHRMQPSTIGELVHRYEPTVGVFGAHTSVRPSEVEVERRILLDGASAADVDYERLLAVSSDEPVDHETSPDDLCFLPHTSGTSGRPKGVMLSHGNVVWNVVNMLSVADVRNDDVTIAVAPFFRTGGTGVNVLPVLFKGGTVVVPEASDPDAMLALLEAHGVTIGFANPDVLEAWLHAPGWADIDLSRLRVLITGGAPVPERLIRAYLERGTTFLQGYGLSEAAPLVLLVDPNDVMRKIGSAGTPPVLVDVRIVGHDDAECSTDETGELWVRGPNVMQGYWRDPVATARALDDAGWLRTGDAARRDHDGFVWIVDRVDDASLVEGHVVYPGDVERALSAHPAVDDVAVLAHRDGVVAFVVLVREAAVTEAELLEHAHEHLPAHAAPQRIVVVDGLPRSTVGKLLRRELPALLPPGG